MMNLPSFQSIGSQPSISSPKLSPNNVQQLEAEIKTPVRSTTSRQKSATKSRPAAEHAVNGDDILNRLRDSDSNAALRAFYALLNIVQEVSLLKPKQPLPFGQSTIGKIRDQLVSMISSASGELQLAILDPDYLQLLFDADILYISLTFLPILRVALASGQNGKVTSQMDIFLDHVAAQLPCQECIELALDAVKTKKGGRYNSESNTKADLIALEQALSDRVIRWLAKTIADKTAFGQVGIEIPQVRQAVQILVLVFSFKATKDAIKLDIISILSFAFQQQPVVFENTLATLDSAISQTIKLAMNIPMPIDDTIDADEQFSNRVSALDISYIDNEQDYGDVTFDEGHLDGYDSDVLNVILTLI